MADAKVCLICGIDANKAKKHERYHHVGRKSKLKHRKDESESDSEDSDDSMIKSRKKGSSSRQAAVVSSRRTRNQNPKAFAISMCKVMELPDTPDHPFLQIFSCADYCQDCMARVKEVHDTQANLEKLQAQIYEAKVDFELEMSKHLGKIPIAKNMRFQYGKEWSDAQQRYEKDLNLILDFNDDGKKTKRAPSAKDGSKRTPKRQQRQAAINSALKMERKRKKGSESEQSDEETNDSESGLEAKKTSKKKKSKYEKDDEEEFVIEGSTSSETEKEKNDPEDACSNSNSNSNDNDKNEPEPDNNSETAVKEDVEEVTVAVDQVQELKVEAKSKKDPSLKCIHCFIPRYFNLAANLEEHINKVHPISCDLCDKRFKVEKTLQNHKANDHGIGTPDTDKNSLYVCGFCDKEFQLKRDLEEHLDNHPEAKPLNCYNCGRGFSRKESLQKGFQIFKGQTVEPCQYCGRNINLKDYLEHNKQLKN